MTNRKSSSLLASVAKTVVATVAVGAVNALLNHTKEQVARKVTCSFTADRNESTLTYAVIARWLVKDGILSTERHATVSSFYVESPDESGDTSVHLPPVGTYFARYRGVRLKIVLTQNSRDAHVGKIVNPVIRIVAFNDRTGVLMKKVRELLRDELSNDRLRIEELSTSRFVVKAKRSIDSVVLTEENHNELITYLDWWKGARDLYESFGITYKTGIFLEGPPGTGKSSLAQAIASYLDMPLVVFSAADAGYRSATIRRNTVVLIEDIDRESVAAKKGKRSSILPVSDTTANILDDINRSLGNDPEGDDPEQDDASQPTNALSDMLNQGLVGKLLGTLDGAVSPDGVVFIMTTNHPDRIDPALIRTGRIDLKLHLGYFDLDRATKLASRFGFTREDVLFFGEDVWREPAKLQLALMRKIRNKNA